MNHIDGQARTGTKNGFDLVIFLLLCIGTYVGFLYYKAFGKEAVQDFFGPEYSNPNDGGNNAGYGFPGFGGAVNNPQQPQPNQRQGFH